MTSSVVRPLLGSSVAVGTDDAVVAFTFDDGPDPDATPAVLDVLRAHGAHATFFVLGERALLHPDLTRRVEAEGHEIGLHGHRHLTLPELSPLAQLRTLAEGRRALVDVLGRPPRLFRAPYGVQEPVTVAIARLLRMRPVMWTAHAAEWTERSIDDCTGLVEHGVRPGGIVLLHDGSAGRNERPRRPILDITDLVDRLLGLATDRGLEAVSVSDLLERGVAERRLWFRSWRV